MPKTSKPNLTNWFVLLVLIFATAVIGINNYNSGIYADVHGLDAGKVGWFAGNGVIIFGLMFLLTLIYAVYLASKARIKS